MAARAALAALHADSIPASVERLPTSRRHRYRVAVRAIPPADSRHRPGFRRSAGSQLAPGRVRPCDLRLPSTNLCCARSRLRGVFLACGSLSRGDGPPQLELLVGSAAAAARVVADLSRLGIPATMLRRRGRPVVEVRSAAGVATLLSSMGAHLGRLEFEAGRVVREVRSGVNRRLNAETANLRRTVTAALAQLEAIDRLERDQSRWEALPGAPRGGPAPAAPASGHPGRARRRGGCSRPAMAGRLHRLVAIGGDAEAG